jgi:hypothetical protein
LNATHQETGRRIIASNIKIERDIFLDSFDELNLLESDMPASTAAHNSARFTYVSPAGKLVSSGEKSQNRSHSGKKSQNRGYVIDGGYFENYGALTALEMARHARSVIEQEKGLGKVKLVILQISSDPTLTKSRTRVRIKNETAECVLTTANPGEASNYLTFVDSGLDSVTHRWKKNDGEGWVVSYLNELAAPLLGVTAVRGAHGNLAAAELASAVCTEKKVFSASAQQAGQKQEPAAINDLLPPETSRKMQSQSRSRQKPGPSRQGRARRHISHIWPCAKCQRTTKHQSFPPWAGSCPSPCAISFLT